MAKVLVLYYSTYGHIEQMAQAVAEGAREAGAEVAVKRVPELVPEEVARNAHYKLDQAAPIATVDELPGYDAIIIGTPTRFGNMAAQMKNFIDQTGGLWAKGALVGKVGRSSPPRPRSMAARNRRSSASTPSCCTRAWWWSACPTASRASSAPTR